MAVLIQVPRAIDRTMFGQLTIDHFMTSVFRTLFRDRGRRHGRGLWMHNLTKAGGPMLNQVIDELAVMPRLCWRRDSGNGAQPVQANVSGEEVLA